MPSTVNRESKTLVFISLICTYVVFAILLNSVGTVILQSIESFGISKTQASTLEGFKDLPIAIVSFLLASWLPRFGFKRAIIIGLTIVTISSALMPIVGGFAMTKLLFLSVGVSFALVKVSVYSTIGLIADTAKQHASKMNLLEGCFMVGVLSGYWIFSFFINPENPASTEWLNVYWLVVILCGIALFSAFAADFPEPEIAPAESSFDSFKAMLSLVWLPFVVMFVCCAFFYVLIEQGLGTWLPTFNKDVLGLSNNISVQITSIFAASLAVGRLSAGVILSKVDWFVFLVVCVVAMALLLLLTIPLTQQAAPTQPISSWSAIPFAAWILPLIGLFMAPIYPAINSVVLSALPKAQHASMTGLIVIFSALGGTFGSLVTGTVFDKFDGQTAFYTMLVPMAILLISLVLYRRAIPALARG
ncbi:MFS transporter [Planctobacterium marinum]|uniref:MFS transporter n=1 Tax=Planctobacterium marinum TaxID=1631968 RepID=A0AA48HUM5_9ALTE|nr:MFS transporter [Planctobacterium marinum]